MVAIAGWLFAKADKVESIEQIILTAGFIVFAFFNLILINGTAKLLEAVSNEIKKSGNNRDSDPLIEPLVNSIGEHRVLFSWVLHFVIDISVVVGIWT